MASITVELPADRAGYGTLRLLDDSGVTIAGPFGVLGLADQLNATNHDNQERSPILKFGNTPLGSYRVAGFRPATGDDDSHRHGPNGKILIIPTGGDASLAQAAGRTGLEIHGGYLTGNKLRPTNGCLRMTDDDMASILSAIITLDTAPNSCSVTEVSVSVSQFGATDIGEEDGDPPPDIDDPMSPMPQLSQP